MAVAAAGVELFLRAGMVKRRPKVRVVVLVAFAVAVVGGVTGMTAETQLVQAEGAEALAATPHAGEG
jgi:hypothetical protein